MVLMNQFLRDSEPKPAAAFAPRDQRVEYSFLNRLRYSWPVVNDLNHDRQGMAFFPQRHLPRGACFEHDRSLVTQGLRRVSDNVEQRLYELLKVADCRRQAHVKIALNHNLARKFRSD